MICICIIMYTLYIYDIYIYIHIRGLSSANIHCLFLFSIYVAVAQVVGGTRTDIMGPTYGWSSKPRPKWWIGIGISTNPVPNQLLQYLLHSYVCIGYCKIITRTCIIMYIYTLQSNVYDHNRIIIYIYKKQVPPRNLCFQRFCWPFYSFRGCLFAILLLLPLLPLLVTLVSRRQCGKQVCQGGGHSKEVIAISHVRIECWVESRPCMSVCLEPVVCFGICLV